MTGQRDLAAGIAELLHLHRHAGLAKVPGGGHVPVHHCTCGEALPDQGPLDTAGAMRVHRFDVHRGDVVAAWLLAG